MDGKLSATRDLTLPHCTALLYSPPANVLIRLHAHPHVHRYLLLSLVAHSFSEANSNRFIATCVFSLKSICRRLSWPQFLLFLARPCKLRVLQYKLLLRSIPRLKPTPPQKTVRPMMMAHWNPARFRRSICKHRPKRSALFSAILKILTSRCPC